MQDDNDLDFYYISLDEVKDTLAETVLWLYDKIGTEGKNLSGSFHNELISETEGRYGRKGAYAFFRAVYWHLCENEILDVDRSYQFKEHLTEERVKNELGTSIVEEHLIYILANLESENINL